MILDNVIIYFCNIYFLPLSRNSSYCFFFQSKFQKVYLNISLSYYYFSRSRRLDNINIFIQLYSKKETV